jgi:predicted ATPase/DNA-binding XRE family transcriptional regulator
VNTISFSYWVRRRRKALDLTQEELARRVACSLATIKKIELDERRPSRLMASRLAECLEVPDADRQTFLRMARAERSPHRLDLSSEPLLQQDERSNLPTPVNALIGRRVEISQVSRLLESPETHLLTLTGPGGVGKTRLALQAAQEVTRKFPGGVWLVELATLSDPGLVVQEVAAVLRVFESSPEPLIEKLIAFLRDRRLLLLLDNCEHLVESCAQLAHALITHCPSLSILATSREPLHITGEAVWPVPPLGLPDLKHLPSLNDLAQVEAIQLFLDRVRHSQPSFSLADPNASAIAEICCRLDGIPLAIELAAARVQVLAPEQIAGRLDDAFRLLTGGERTALPKHRTLQATLDWSYDMLSEKEQLLFRRLAVFAGGFNLEAAEAICSDGDEIGLSSSDRQNRSSSERINPSEILDLLSSLVVKSLVSVVRAGGQERRYRLLEIVRQYAGGKLFESGELAILQEWHFRHYLLWVEKIEPELQTSQALLRLNQLDTELDNLRAALEYSFRQSRSGAELDGLRLASMLGRLWADKCYWSEGRAWLERGLALLNFDDPLLAGILAKALLTAGVLAAEQYDGATARIYFEQSAAFCVACGDQITHSGVLVQQAIMNYFNGNRPLAHTLVDEAEGICRAIGYKWGLAMALTIKGGLFCWQEKNYAEALSSTEESIRLFLETGDRWEAYANYSQMGWILLQTGDYVRARDHTERAIDSYRELNDRAALAYATEIMGHIAHMQKDYDQSIAYFQETMTLRRSLGHERWVDNLLYWLGLVLVEMGETQRGAEVLAERLSRLQNRGRPISSLDDLVGWAGVVLAYGDAVQAAEMLAAFKTHSPRYINWREVNENAIYERALARIQSKLDPAAFTSAWDQGTAMSAEQAIEEVLTAASRVPAAL